MSNTSIQNLFKKASGIMKNQINSNAYNSKNMSDTMNVSDTLSIDNDLLVLHHGTKYNFTDEQILDIAKLCRQEQDSLKGSAGEASLMANLYELRYILKEKKRNQDSRSVEEDFYNFVKYGKWWSHSAEIMESKREVSEETVNAIREVLNNGNRTIPFYVNEHDCFQDITKIENYGVVITDKDEIRNKSNYIPNVTKIKNIEDESSDHYTYTFWGWLDDTSDPFGYTDDSIEIFNNTLKNEQMK